MKRILIRSTNWIGDAVMTTPAISTLKKILPDSKIDIMAKPWVAPVFINNPNIDKIIIYDRDGNLKPFIKRLEFLYNLRKEKYDIGILFPNSFSSALELKVIGCSQIIGYEGNLRNIFLDEIIKRNKNSRVGHEIFYYIKIIEQFKPSEITKKLELFITDTERANIRNFLNRNKFDDNNWIVISPGAAYGSAKMWGIDNVRKLSKKLIDRGIKIILTGSPNDFQNGEKIKKEMEKYILNLSGKISLREFFSLLSFAPCFLTNDSGPMHIGAALNVKMVAIFGSTDVFATGPWSLNATVIRKKLKCSPCKKRECPLGHMECMKKISVEEVEKKILMKLSE